MWTAGTLWKVLNVETVLQCTRETDGSVRGMLAEMNLVMRVFPVIQQWRHHFTSADLVHEDTEVMVKNVSLTSASVCLHLALKMWNVTT